ncbi:hypothetical protein [Acidaminococcus fermentans]|uniref:hypothetical protein n=1 Tax=Acidaminococcus fermentans TaxID=905 RepID=UPI002493224E|nr:hypothetical protein [Acidaminococcus fermentans]
MVIKKPPKKSEWGGEGFSRPGYERPVLAENWKMNEEILSPAGGMCQWILAHSSIVCYSLFTITEKLTKEE